MPRACTTLIARQRMAAVLFLLHSVPLAGGLAQSIDEIFQLNGNAIERPNAVSAGGDTVVLHDYGFAVRFVRGKGAIVTFVDVDGQVAISIHLSSRAVNISSWCSSFSS